MGDVANSVEEKIWYFKLQIKEASTLEEKSKKVTGLMKNELG